MAMRKVLVFEVGMLIQISGASWTCSQHWFWWKSDLYFWSI